MLKVLKLAPCVLAVFISSACQLSESQEDSALKVVYGQRVKANEWIASSTLALVASPESSVPYCTAVLIQDDMLVTAAHCIDPEQTRVTLAVGTDAAKASVFLQGQALRHESYDAPYNEPFSFDLALIKLDEKAPTNLRPVSIASEADFQLGSEVTLAGFGISTKSKAADADWNRDNTLLYKMTSAIDRIYSLDEDDVAEYGLIGTQSRDGLSAVCEGDSGGPVFVRTGDTFLLAGLTVGGFGSCNTRAYHTNLAFYSSWMSDKLASWESPAPAAGVP